MLLDTGGGPASGGGRGRWTRLAAAAVAAIVVVGGTLLATSSGHHHQAGPAATPPAGPAVTSGTATGPVSPAGGPLLRGTPTVYGGGTRKVYGCPVGYPHTYAGAVQAAINYLVVTGSTVELSAATRPGLAAAIATPAQAKVLLGGAAADAAIAARDGIDPATGAYLDPTTGQPSPTVHAYSDVRPEYGAYRVTAATPDAVTVELWAPLIGGHGSPDDLSGLQVQWFEAAATVVWIDRDWRLDVTPPVTGAGVPRPSNPADPAVPFAERAKLVPGWLLTADASEVEDWAPLVGRT